MIVSQTGSSLIGMPFKSGKFAAKPSSLRRSVQGEPAAGAGWNACRRRLYPAVLAFLVSACSLAPGRKPPVLEAIAELPGEFAGSEIDGSHEPREWWKTFADPALDRVIEEVLASNFDLAGAVARVDQARARERIARAPVFPLLQPALGVDSVDGPTNAGIGAQLEELGLGSGEEAAPGIVLPDRLGLTTYHIGAEFAYELDFWGRNRNDGRAAGAERLASESDYRAARMGVLAETVRTCLEIVNLRRQRRLAGEIVEIFQHRQSLAASRYDRGLTAVSPLRTARRNLRNAQAGLPPIAALLADAEGRLRVLLGGFRADLADLLPESMNPSASLEPVPAGIPADLLTQRPDVSAARQRLEAARYAVGARRAELLPRLSLSGSIGLQSTEPGELFDPDQWFRNLGANLLGPVFQGARLRGNVALAQARLNEAAAAFGRSVVTAVSEVEAALAGLEASRRRHSLLASLAEEARAESGLAGAALPLGCG